MTKESIAENEALKALLSEGPDHLVLAEMLGFVADRLMSLDADQLCGAGKHERSADRANQRNGYRSCAWESKRQVAVFRAVVQALVGPVLKDSRTAS